MRDNNFIFDCFNLLHYKLHYRYDKINLKHGQSCIDSDWIKNKAIMNPINDDDKYFQYTATVTFNYEEIGRNFKRI